MKTHLIALAVSLAAISLAAGQTWTEADTLSPKDLGIYKYVITQVPDKDQVVVLELKKFVQSKLEEHTEHITYKPNKTVSSNILLFDPAICPFVFGDGKTQSLLLTYGFGNRSFSGQKLEAWGAQDQILKFHFTDQDGQKITYQFRVLLEPLKVVVKRHPEIQETIDSSLGYWSRMATNPTTDE